jgi:hypothetical protein
MDYKNGTKKCKINGLFYTIFENYIWNFTLVFGTIANCLCCIGFVVILWKEFKVGRSHLQRQPISKGHMYKYLLIKSICDFLYVSIELGWLIYERDDGLTIDSTYIMQVWYVWFDNYLTNVAQLASSYFEVLAALDCFLTISNRHFWFKKVSTFIILTCFGLIFCFIFIIPMKLSNTIQYINETCSDMGYESVHVKSFIKTDIYRLFLLFISILRDILPLILLIIINVLIYFILKEVTRRRLTLDRTGTNNMIQASQKAERNKIKMIILTSLIFNCHIPKIFYNLRLFNLHSNDCFNDISYYLLILSYCLNIFSYILYNSTFRKCFSNSFKCFFFCFLKK